MGTICTKVVDSLVVQDQQISKGNGHGVVEAVLKPRYNMFSL